MNTANFKFAIGQTVKSAVVNSTGETITNCKIDRRRFGPHDKEPMYLMTIGGAGMYIVAESTIVA